jgi:transcriptional regulator with XRE-family HTH domain
MTLDQNELELLAKFGKRIQTLRKLKNMTQEDLAAKAGFSRTYCTEIERGKRNISLINMQKLADALESPLLELLKLDD